MTENQSQQGGFLPSLPSPSPSTSSQHTTTNLPHPRSHPLKPGSAKEDTARRYVETRLLHISRRYTKKFQPLQEDEDQKVKGYESMSEVAKDLSEVVDVLWLSGTPNLQIPYLLNVALSVLTYLPSFPPSPSSTFSLLRKLDHVFSSLMKGEDSVSGERLPGFENGAGGGNGMSRTDMVRCKSLVEGTRVLVVEVMGSRPAGGDEDGTETEMETETETGTDIGDEAVEGKGWEMDVARVYEGTIEQLNILLAEGSGFGTGGVSS